MTSEHQKGGWNKFGDICKHSKLSFFTVGIPHSSHMGYVLFARGGGGVGYLLRGAIKIHGNVEFLYMHGNRLPAGNFGIKRRA